MDKPTLKELTGRNHVSYSSFDTYQQCGEKFRLTRVLQVEEGDAWWFYGGTAFHTAAEWWDLGDAHALPEIWKGAWDKATENLDPKKDIRAGGRATKAYPDKENDAWWNEHGPKMLEDYVKWRNTSGWEIYTDNGVPFVEWEFTVSFPREGKDEVAVKGFIDRVFVNPEGELIVCDLKTGSREPASTTQLGTYAVAMGQRGGVSPLLGCYYMSRKGEPSANRSLIHYTPEMLSYWLGSFADSVRDERFIPNVTSMCQSCMVAPSCYAVGGNAPYALPFQK